MITFILWLFASLATFCLGYRRLTSTAYPITSDSFYIELKLKYLDNVSMLRRKKCPLKAVVRFKLLYDGFIFSSVDKFNDKFNINNVQSYHTLAYLPYDTRSYQITSKIQCDAIRWERFLRRNSSWTALTGHLGMKISF